MATTRTGIRTREARRQVLTAIAHDFRPDDTELLFGGADPIPVLLAIIGAELCDIGAAAEKVARALDKQAASLKARASNGKAV